MDRFSKFWCDPVRVVKTVLALALCVGVVVYVYLQVIGGFDSEIQTETALHVYINDYIDAQCCIFRDEEVMDTEGNGAVVTLVSEAERISKGQLIANVYDNADDALLQDEVGRINRRLEILSDSSVDKQFVISDLRQLDDDIDEIFADVYKSAASGSLSSAIDSGAELLVKLNKRDLIVESDFDYSGELEKLASQKTEIEAEISSASTPVIATHAGYFFGEVDGYEKMFDVSLVDKITLSDFERLTEAEPDDTVGKSNVKIVKDFLWYLVCRIDAEKARTLTVGHNYTLSFPENADYEMQMKLDKVVSETNSPLSLAVFRVNVLPGDFNYKRFQKAEIVVNGIEGISVPKKALRVVNGVEGVYILVGDVVRFRAIDRISEKGAYYIVKLKSDAAVFESDTEQEISVKPLSLYDNIIVSGKQLFDGKIIG